MQALIARLKHSFSPIRCSSKKVPAVGIRARACPPDIGFLLCEVVPFSALHFCLLGGDAKHFRKQSAVQTTAEPCRDGSAQRYKYEKLSLPFYLAPRPAVL
jgi:hypothetical protein